MTRSSDLAQGQEAPASLPEDTSGCYVRALPRAPGDWQWGRAECGQQQPGSHGFLLLGLEPFLLRGDPLPPLCHRKAGAETPRNPHCLATELARKEPGPTGLNPVLSKSARQRPERAEPESPQGSASQAADEACTKEAEGDQNRALDYPAGCSCPAGSV